MKRSAEKVSLTEYGNNRTVLAATTKQNKKRWEKEGDLGGETFPKLVFYHPFILLGRLTERLYENELSCVITI